MKFYQKLDGGVHISAREYDIAYNTAITQGQLVKLSGGLVVSASAGETGALLGVAAENHSGVADALDPRANGTKILVIDDPNVIYQCKAVPVAQGSSAASATTLVAKSDDLAAFSDDDFNGGYVKCVEKGASSTNTDAIGKVRRITDFTAASKTFTLESGGTPCEDDVYEVFPPVGFAKGNLNSTKDGLVLSTTASISVRVTGADIRADKINVQIKKHVFAVDA